MGGGNGGGGLERIEDGGRRCGDGTNSVLRIEKR